MLMLTLVLALSASTAQDQERANDTGRTLNRVDALRAQGAYDDAANELRGWMERWSAFDSPTFFGDVERMRALMKKMVEMQELLQEAPDDGRAARRLLAHLVEGVTPTARTAEQVRALQLLARHDPEVQELLDAAFPARLVVEIDGLLTDERLLSFPLENALADLSRDALPIGRGPGASELRVRLMMRENDTSNSVLFSGTSMRSYAVHLSAELVGADGESIARAATTTAVLGINPGNGAKSGMPKCARLIYQELVDEIAKRAVRKT